MIDLCVSKILNVYQKSTSNWCRSIPIPREKDGIVLFTEGEIEYTFPNRSVVASRGSVLLLPKDIPYFGIAKSEKVAYFVLDFDLVSENDFLNLGAPCAIKAEGFRELCASFSSILTIWDRQHIDAQIKSKAFLYSLIGQLIEKKEKIPDMESDSEPLPYIYSHYSDPQISVDSICKKFFISESQLRRNILKATGLSPNEYITSLRINKAKKELICTNKSIKQIAHECGFSSAYYFSRCFSQHVGTSPNRYRQKNPVL